MKVGRLCQLARLRALLFSIDRFDSLTLFVTGYTSVKSTTLAYIISACFSLDIFPSQCWRSPESRDWSTLCQQILSSETFFEKVLACPQRTLHSDLYGALTIYKGLCIADTRNIYLQNYLNSIFDINIGTDSSHI